MIKSSFFNKLSLSLGMLGSSLFIIISLLDGITRPFYNSLYHTISHLSLGSRAFLGISSSIIIGIIMLGFSFSIRHRKLKEVVPLSISRLIFILGLCLIITAVFVMDPMMGYPPNFKPTLTLRGFIHYTFTGILILTLISLCLLSIKKFKALSMLKWSVFSFISGLIIIISNLIYLVLSALDLLDIWKGTPIGFVERITFYTGYIWIFSYSYWLVNSWNKYENLTI